MRSILSIGRPPFWSGRAGVVRCSTNRSISAIRANQRKMGNKHSAAANKHSAEALLSSGKDEDSPLRSSATNLVRYHKVSFPLSQLQIQLPELIYTFESRKRHIAIVDRQLVLKLLAPLITEPNDTPVHTTTEPLLAVYVDLAAFLDIAAVVGKLDYYASSGAYMNLPLRRQVGLWLNRLYVCAEQAYYESADVVDARTHCETADSIGAPTPFEGETTAQRHKPSRPHDTLPHEPSLTHAL